MLGRFVGRQFGNYRLQRFLARGRFAEVYLGEHVSLKTLAAIKILRLHLPDEACTSFLQEAQTVARLQHPQIISLLEFGVEQEHPFLVMSYAACGTLRQRFPHGTAFPPAAIVPYLKQIASALDYTHQQKVIHQDVRPENILLQTSEELVLSDFSLATLSEHISPAERPGTLMYMAPEQLQGKASYASDQYALGVMVYEWLTGNSPFVDTPMELAPQYLSVPFSLMQRSLSDTLEEIVMRALSKDPGKRFPCPGDFALAFEQEAGLLPPIHITSHPIEVMEDSPELLLDPPQAIRGEEPLLTMLGMEHSWPNGLQEKSYSLPLVLVEQEIHTPIPPRERVSQLLPIHQKTTRQSRRNVLLTLTGIIAIGAGGAGLTALLLHPQPSSTLSPRQQVPHPSTSTAGSTTSTKINSTSIPAHEASPTVKATPGAALTPGSSPTSGVAATPTSQPEAALSLQIQHVPAMLVNKQMATIEVVASEPGVLVNLDVSYNQPSAMSVSVSHYADSSGHALLSWSVKVPQAHKGGAQAMLLVSATDTKGHSANAQPFSLPVSG